MNLWFRVLAILLAGIFRPRLGLDGESRVCFRVWPTDLDINVHMTNARYLSLMDLGRLDLMIRTGMAKLAWHRGLRPVVAGITVRYRRSLLPFQRFLVRTRVLGWDDKWMFVETRFEWCGELVCLGVAKGLFLDGATPCSPADLAVALAPGMQSPQLPAWVVDWQAAESKQIEATRIFMEGQQCVP